MTMWANQRLRESWVERFILHEECKPQGAHILKKISGPHEDGSVVKLVTDGEVSVNAVFTKEAIEKEFTLSPSQEEFDGESQPEWDKCAILVKKYKLHHVNHENLFGCHFCIIVEHFSFWGHEMGLRFKTDPEYCMEIDAVRTKSRRLWEEWRLHQAKSQDSTMNSIPLSMLIGEMDKSSQSIPNQTSDSRLEPLSDERNSLTLDRNFDDVQIFLINQSDQKKLDEIKEWRADYEQPNEETCPSAGSHVGNSPNEIAREISPNNGNTDMPAKMVCENKLNMSVQVGDSLLANAAPSQSLNVCSEVMTKECGNQVGQSLLDNVNTEPSQKANEKNDGSCSPLPCIEEDNENAENSLTVCENVQPDSIPCTQTDGAPAQNAVVQSTQQDGLAEIPVPNFPVSPLSQFKSFGNSAFVPVTPNSETRKARRDLSSEVAVVADTTTEHEVMPQTFRPVAIATNPVSNIKIISPKFRPPPPRIGGDEDFDEPLQLILDEAEMLDAPKPSDQAGDEPKPSANTPAKGKTEQKIVDNDVQPSTTQDDVNVSELKRTVNDVEQGLVQKSDSDSDQNVRAESRDCRSGTSKDEAIVISSGEVKDDPDESFALSKPLPDHTSSRDKSTFEKLGNENLDNVNAAEVENTSENSPVKQNKSDSTVLVSSGDTNESKGSSDPLSGLAQKPFSSESQEKSDKTNSEESVVIPKMASSNEATNDLMLLQTVSKDGRVDNADNRHSPKGIPLSFESDVKSPDDGIHTTGSTSVTHDVSLFVSTDSSTTAKCQGQEAEPATALPTGKHSTLDEGACAVVRKPAEIDHVTPVQRFAGVSASTPKHAAVRVAGMEAELPVDAVSATEPTELQNNAGQISQPACKDVPEDVEFAEDESTVPVTSENEKEVLKSPEKTVECSEKDTDALTPFRMSQFYRKINVESQQLQKNAPEQARMITARSRDSLSSADRSFSENSGNEADGTVRSKKELLDMFIVHTSPKSKPAPKLPLSKSVLSVTAQEKEEKDLFNNSITPVKRVAKKKRKVIDSETDSDFSFTEEMSNAKSQKTLQNVQPIRAAPSRKTFAPNKTVQENIRDMLVSDQARKYNSAVLFNCSVKPRKGKNRLLARSRKTLYCDKGSVLMELPEESQCFETARTSFPGVLEENPENRTTEDRDLPPDDCLVSDDDSKPQNRQTNAKKITKTKKRKLKRVETTEKDVQQREDLTEPEQETVIKRKVRRTHKSQPLRKHVQATDDGASDVGEATAGTFVRLRTRKPVSYRETQSVTEIEESQESGKEHSNHEAPSSNGDSADVIMIESDSQERQDPNSPPATSSSIRNTQPIVDENIMGRLKQCVIRLTPIHFPVKASLGEDSGSETENSEVEDVKKTPGKSRVVLKTSVIKVPQKPPPTIGADAETFFEVLSPENSDQNSSKKNKSSEVPCKSDDDSVFVSSPKTVGQVTPQRENKLFKQREHTKDSVSNPSVCLDSKERLSAAGGSCGDTSESASSGKSPRVNDALASQVLRDRTKNNIVFNNEAVVKKSPRKTYTMDRDGSGDISEKVSGSVTPSNELTSRKTSLFTDVCKSPKGSPVKAGISSPKLRPTLFSGSRVAAASERPVTAAKSQTPAAKDYGGSPGRPSRNKRDGSTGDSKTAKVSVSDTVVLVNKVEGSSAVNSPKPGTSRVLSIRNSPAAKQTTKSTGLRSIMDSSRTLPTPESNTEYIDKDKASARSSPSKQRTGSPVTRSRTESSAGISLRNSPKILRIKSSPVCNKQSAEGSGSHSQLLSKSASPITIHGSSSSSNSDMERTESHVQRSEGELSFKSTQQTISWLSKPRKLSIETPVNSLTSYQPIRERRSGQSSDVIPTQFGVLSQSQIELLKKIEDKLEGCNISHPMFNIHFSSKSLQGMLDEFR